MDHPRMEAGSDMSTTMAGAGSRNTERLVSMLRTAAADLSPSAVNALIAHPDALRGAPRSDRGAPGPRRERRPDARCGRGRRATNRTEIQCGGSEEDHRRAHRHARAGRRSAWLERGRGTPRAQVPPVRPRLAAQGQDCRLATRKARVRVPGKAVRRTQTDRSRDSQTSWRFSKVRTWLGSGSPRH